MPLGTLDWNLRNNDGELSKDRGWTLVLLYWHSNAHGRCWPSMATLCKEIGCGSQKADAIIDWLVEHGALMKVPVDKRETEEKELSERKTVYQLTGVIQIQNQWRFYLAGLNDETHATLKHLVASLCAAGNAIHDLIIKQLSFENQTINDLKIKKSNRLKIKHEGIALGKGIPGKVSAPAQKPNPTPSKESPTAANATPQPPIAAPPPSPPEFDIERAKLILAMPSHIQNFEIDGMTTHLIIDAYERAIGAPMIASRNQKLAALKAQVAGYTADEVFELTTRKTESGEEYPFAWMITDLPSSRKMNKPRAPIQFAAYVPPPQAAPVSREEIEAIKARVQAEFDAEKESAS